jgi:molybdopterin converting factor subunit 1
MRIRLRFFASLRERLGRSEQLCEVPSGATVATVWEMLKREHPDLAAVERAVAFAVAQEYVDKDHSLQDNDELAFIPPVSGGAMTDEATRILCRITQDPIDLRALTDFVADPAAGAMTTFIGTTRNTNDGRQVIRLEYECYPGMAEKEMQKIAAAVLTRWPITKIAMIHRLGRVDIGEASVAIAVSSSHRHAAFEACHYAINQLKETVPIWKKELYEGGELWIGSQTGRVGSFQRVQEEERV